MDHVGRCRQRKPDPGRPRPKDHQIKTFILGEMPLEPLDHRTSSVDRRVTIQDIDAQQTVASAEQTCQTVLSLAVLEKD